MKTALITGITGQDGAYLARLLLDKGYRVVGAARRNASGDLWRLRKLGVHEDELELESIDLLEQCNVIRLVDKVAPDEVYNLAAQTFVGSSFEQPCYTVDVNAIGPLRILEALRGSRCRFYQASTSEMFGNSQAPQNEMTPFRPCSPYGIAKLAAHWLTINYREAYELFACCGILFNHESPLRGKEFVTQKIAQGLARIREGVQERLVLGNLDAERDWGFAGDYVEAMWFMMQQDTPLDYVIASGTTCSIRNFISLVAKALDMELDWFGFGREVRAQWQGNTIISVSPKYYRPADVHLLCGDARRAHELLGWEPNVSLPALAHMMAMEALNSARP